MYCAGNLRMERDSGLIPREATARVNMGKIPKPARLDMLGTAFLSCPRGDSNWAKTRKIREEEREGWQEDSMQAQRPWGRQGDR